MKPVPKLSDYAAAPIVATANCAVWQQLAQWQRAGLVRVVPLSKWHARVELTEAGRRAIAG